MDQARDEGLREELAEDDAGDRWHQAADGTQAPFAVLQCPVMLTGTEGAAISWHSTVASILANLLGVGVLALPRALARAGLLTGLLAMVGVAFAMRETLMMLLSVSASVCRSRTSYPEIAKQTLGPQGLAVVLFAILLYSAGLLAAYLAALADVLSQLLAAAAGAGPRTYSRALLVLASLVMCLPGTLLRTPKRGLLLGGVCILGGTLLVVVLLTVCLGDVMPPGEGTPPDRTGVSSSVDFVHIGAEGLLSAAALFTAQFCMHAGVIEVLSGLGAARGEELEVADGGLGGFDSGGGPPGRALDGRDALRSGFRAAVPLAAAVGAAGYLRFGGQVQGNVLSSFTALYAADGGWRRLALLAGRAACALVLVAAFASTSVSCRSTAAEIFAVRRSAGGTTSRKEHQVTAVILAICSLTAWLVEDLAALLGFLGAWAAGPLGLVLPALFRLEQARRQEGRPLLSGANLRPLCILALGVLLMLGSVGSLLAAAFHPRAGHRGSRVVLGSLSGIRGTRHHAHVGNYTSVDGAMTR